MFQGYMVEGYNNEKKYIFWRGFLKVYGKRVEVALGVNPDTEYMISDLYVFNVGNVRSFERFADDDKFVGGVMEVLRGLGYTGRDFGRAELGLQFPSHVVLEGESEGVGGRKSFGWWVKGLEVGWIRAIPFSDLPLHLHDIYTKAGRRLFNKRMREGI